MISVVRLKMQALLVQHGLLEVLKGPEKMNVGITEKEKMMMIEKAHNIIILSLYDKVLRHVSKDKTTTGVWSKLEGLYMTKSLINRLFLKQSLYSFNMSQDRVFMDQLKDGRFEK